MTIATLKEQKLILLECISGSKAYGLDTPTSDTDIKGVFLLPKRGYYGLHYIPQVSNETNDIVYYELGRFIELLSVNNPNILELLSSPVSAVLYRHPFLDAIQPEMFLSKLCQNTFGKFALAQIKKAKGLNKKIVNPVDRERKSVLSFCFVNYEKGAVPLLHYLSLHGWQQEHCGLVNIPHMKNMYGLYHSDQELYHGIIKSDDSNDVSLSSISKEEEQQALLYFNKDGYSSYCKEYKEYWEWVEKRNNVRYATAVSQNYDTKNMMHTFRLLDMAIEIGRDHAVNVQRPNRDFLLKIRSGAYEYEELLAMADQRRRAMEEAFEHSTLPDTPNVENINRLAYEMRDRLYTVE